MGDKLCPLFLVKPKTISARDVKRIEAKCGIIVAECSDPDSARYSEPPIDLQMDLQSQAALRLARYLINKPDSQAVYRGEITKFLVDVLMQGQPLIPSQRVPQVKKQ